MNEYHHWKTVVFFYLLLVLIGAHVLIMKSEYVNNLLSKTQEMTEYRGIKPGHGTGFEKHPLWIVRINESKMNVNSRSINNFPRTTQKLIECQEIKPGHGAGFEKLPLWIVQRGDSTENMKIEEVFSIFACGVLLENNDNGKILMKAVDMQNRSSYLKIIRKKECIELDNNVSLKLGPEKEMKRFGPDDFIVSLEGAEIVALAQHHIGHCTYIFPFPRISAHVFTVRVILTRQKYDALNEQVSYAPPHLHDLLGDRTFIEIHPTSKLHTELECYENYSQTPGRWVDDYNTNSGTAEVNNYVACPQVGKTGARHPDFRGGGSGRTWHVDPRRYHWLPYGCLRKRISDTNIQSAFSNRRMFFIGDSHMRTHFNFILAVCNIPGKAMKGYASSQCFTPDSSSLCAGALLCMEHNPLGTDIHMNTENVKSVKVQSLSDPWDVIFFNFGHHFASGHAHCTVDEFARRIENIMRNLTFIRDRAFILHSCKTELVWQSIHAMPFARDIMQQKHQDWRTNQRLALYERSARRIIEKLNLEYTKAKIRYIDVFNMTLPMMEAAAGDCGHYTIGNVQEAITELTLNVLCSLENISCSIGNSNKKSRSDMTKRFGDWRDALYKNR